MQTLHYMRGFEHFEQFNVINLSDPEVSLSK